MECVDAEILAAPKNTFAFTREKRLCKRYEFQHAFEHAIKVTSGPFVFLASPNTFGRPRLGVVISKKKINRAVDRNHMRRLIRETFRHQTDLIGGFDFIVLPKQGLKAKDGAFLRKRLMQQWQQCIVYCNKQQSCSFASTS